MTKLYAVPANHAAAIQLTWAIRLLLDHQAFVPAITLAGAARGILEVQLGQQAESATAYSSIKESLAAQGFGTRDDIGKAINAPRNFLKHAGDNAFDPNGADLQSIAIYEITLATTNLARLDKSLVPDVPRFLEWISANRPDLKEHIDNSDTC